jgi:AraC-like DNA-binding protein
VRPDLELVRIGQGECFHAWEHGYPFRTVRWHFHPACEIHFVAATMGRYFVGDFIGDFAPGNLVLTGPNLPHNWISDVEPDELVPLRSRVVQFPEAFVADAAAVFPELAAFEPVLALSRRGALFGRRTSEIAAPMLAELMEARGIRRVELFISLLGTLSRDDAVQPLASAGYLPDPSGFISAGINKALTYIDAHLTEPFTEGDLAAIASRSSSAFSRSFRRHTGMALVQYVNRLRVNLACQLLMGDECLPITEIAFAVGFNNLSNFNRQFLAQKGMPPSRFRALLAQNATVAGAREYAA